MKTKFILIINDEDGTRYQIYSDCAKAEKAFEEYKQDYIQNAIEDNELTDEEADEYVQEIEDSCNYIYDSWLNAADPDGNWDLKIVEAEEE